MIHKKVLKKWTFITVLCAAHSFFWGVMTKASPEAMLLGVATLILFFTLIESSGLYQSRRTAAPRFARAMDWGVRFRVYLAAYIIVMVAIVSLVPKALGAFGMLGAIAAAPYFVELYIGMFAVAICRELTGFDLSVTSGDAMVQGTDRFMTSYVATLVTGGLHTVLLGFICLLAYGVIRMRGKRSARKKADISPIE